MTKPKQHRNRTLIALIIVIIGIALVAGFFIMRSSSPETEPEPTEPVIAIPGDQPPYNFDYSWTQHPYIAHAMGGILGDTYTNSYEAFLLNYTLGHRVFEVDFYLTEDKETVSTHYAENWHANTKTPDDVAFTANNFGSYLSEGKYHPLTYKEVVDIMSKYPDIYVVTDSKYTDREQSDYEFKQIIDYAKATDPAALDRIIVQIYRPEMLDWVMELYPWKSVIYTLYSDPDWTTDNVIKFAKTSGVKFITIWDGVVEPDFIAKWDAAGLILAAHTINNLSTLQSLRDMGFDLFYTDFLLP